jgi:integrase
MLTEQTIRRLRARPSDYWRSDSNSDGTTNNLYLRVRSTGAKTWHVRRMKDGVLLNKKIGKWPDLGLKAARTRAQDFINGVIDGEATLKAVTDEWFTQKIESRYKRPAHVRQYLDRLPAGLLARPIHEIDRLEVARALQHYARTRGPVSANRLLAILKQCFGYAHKVGYVPDNALAPLTRDEVGGEEKPVERVLTDDEIRALWNTDTQHTALLRFLLLTGQRIGEAQLAEWSHIHGDRWSIPAAHSKNGRAHWVALSRQALALLREQSNDRDLIFGRVTNTGVQAWLRRWCERETIDPAFTPHDLRRTAATRMNEIGIAPHVVEKILNHSMQGVMAVYNKAEYADERTAAMQQWSDEIDRILAGAGT